ncbi:hypothetical protein DV738_g3666, partial [Chaetothyriales sp. CBS 135597]
MPPPTDRRARGHGRGTRYGARGVRRGPGIGRAGPYNRPQGAPGGNLPPNPNRRWEYANLLQQQATLIKREETKPSPHMYRYICPEPGCGVSANDAREISRHYNWSEPPLHPGREHVPSRTLQGVFYKDWLRDENLEATKYATTDKEFYDEFELEHGTSERQKE